MNQQTLPLLQSNSKICKEYLYSFRNGRQTLAAGTFVSSYTTAEMTWKHYVKMMGQL